MSISANSRLAAVVMLLGIFTIGPRAATAQSNPFDETIAPLEIGQRMPATSFVDQNGQKVSFASQQGKVTLIGFMYTRCRDACPIITEKFVQLDRELGSGPYHLSLVTIDPIHDSPSALRAFAAKHGARSPRLDFLTGDISTVGRFVRSAGVAVVDNGRGELIHNAQLLVISGDGRIADVVSLVAWEPRNVAAEMEHLAGVASSPLARADFALTKSVAQFCGGSYQIASGVIDAFAALIVLGGGAFALLWMRRRLFAQGA